jgi:hypothetical protein
MNPYQKCDAGLLQALTQEDSFIKHAVQIGFQHADTKACDLAVAYVLRAVGPGKFSGHLTALEIRLLTAHTEVRYVKLLETLTLS